MTALLDSLGCDAVDAGPLAEGWRFQHDTAAYVTPYLGDANDWDRAKPAGAEEVRAALAAAKRYV